MNYKFYLFLHVGILFSSKAQFIEHFERTSFRSPSIWAGDLSAFRFDNGELRLNAKENTKNAYLTTRSEAIDDATWQGKVRFAFNPSKNNYATIYLTSDQSDLTKSLHGYFVRVGSGDDEISLYKQEGISLTKIIDGENDRINASTVTVQIKVSRTAQGLWKLYTNVGVDNLFTLEGSVLDNTFDTSSYFGLQCFYTSTRSDKFYFDDFIVEGTKHKDGTPPILISVNAISTTELVIKFDEEVDPASTRKLQNYHLGSEDIEPFETTLQNNRRAVKLTFSVPFGNGIRYLITVTKIRDLRGNEIVNQSTYFMYLKTFPPVHKDIILTEIFSNARTEQGFFDAEFIELYNRKTTPFNLEGWKLGDKTKTITLPKFIILPKKYIIITSNKEGFNTVSPDVTLIVSNFLSLNNDGDRLTLKDPIGSTIDSVNYMIDWWREKEKQQGGWSLELIDTENLCGEETNWAASEDAQRATPGRDNSVLANKPDLTGPKLLSVFAPNTHEVVLVFDERLETPLRTSISFTLNPFLVIKSSALIHPSLRSIRLMLESSLQSKQVYTVTLNNLADCSGNAIQKEFSHTDFALPEAATEGDIVINEILFDPRPNGVDFVEIYNLSDKYINLENWRIGNFHQNNPINLTFISKEAMMIKPTHYCVLTSAPRVVKDQYIQGDEAVFKKISLPTLPNDEGSVAIVDHTGKTIDYFLYHKNLHSIFINDEKGVSLERISFFEKSTLPDNWHSASSTAGFATPGLINSNARTTQKIKDGEVKIVPVLFNPYGTIDYFTKIHFKFNQNGLVANVVILDHRGRLIKTIANNEVLGFDGFFRWDGDTDKGNKARPGYYYVKFNIFDLTGLSQTFTSKIIIMLP